MSTSTATMLFCDIVDSTDHRAQLGEVRADEFFRALEDRFRAVVDGCGGRVVKGGGDGVMAVFQAASEAVAGAMALQRAVQSNAVDLELRVGLASGDVTIDDDDCFGMPVVVAARLQGACEPGQILVSTVVRHLAGDRVTADYEPVGPLELKGVPEPVEAYAVAWQHLDTEASAWRFPATLPRSAEPPFVGRGPELDTLARAWADAKAGDTSVVFLGGEAGAGKTRLATEFAHRCHRDGAIVLAGVCDSELSLPYQPWVMVIDQLISQLPAAMVGELRSELIPLRVLVPQLEEVLRGAAPVAPRDPEAERLGMFEAAVTLLRAASELAPLHIVLDDVHWAGHQTFDLLRFLVSTRRLARCMVTATHRDTSAEVTGHLATALADYRRSDMAVHLKLTGMDGDAVNELLDRLHVGGDLRARAELITARTGGNAFLVTELARHPTGDVVPESVMDVVKARLLRLDHDARELADLIAVAGRAELPVLVEATQARSIDLSNGLGELTRSGLVQELEAAVPTYQFAHALIRDAVGEGLSAFDAAMLHEVLAQTIEQVHTSDRRPVLPELARHYAAAASLAGWNKAAYYGRRAAAQARRTAAYEEAIELIETALGVTPIGTEERALLLIDAVDLMQRSGRNRDAVSLAEEAYETSVDIDAPVLQANTSIEIERSAHLANAELARSLAPLKAVLGGAPELPDEVRIRAMASLGRASWLNGVANGPALTSSALDSARALGDPATICHALEMACVVERDPSVALSHARELERRTGALDNVFQSMWAMTRQTDALFTMGQMADAEVVLDRLRSFAERYRFTSYLFLSKLFSHTLALAAGAFDLAEAATEAADGIQQQSEGLDAGGAYGLQMFMIRRAQGRLEEMRPVLEIIARSGATTGVWRPGLVLAYAELGMLDEAARDFDELTTGSWDSLPRDTLWPLALMFLTDTCMILERSDVASQLLNELAPHAGLTIRAGYTTNGGPADRCRAALAELAGDHLLADQCIAGASELALSSGSPVWRAMVESTWAWILARRGDLASATSRHGTATQIANRIGMGSIPAVPDAVTSPTKSVSASATTFRRDGLSDRELEVLVELSLGRTNRQIAERLYISPNTAANHVRAILRKTGCANRTEAAMYAIRQGIGGGADERDVLDG